jgi:predicted nucleic acid-binding protein
VSHLIDTNILSRVIVVKDALSPMAEAAIDALQGRGEHLVVAPQNLMEFWAVATRPRQLNGLGLARESVVKEIERFESMFAILDESPAVYRRWRQLVEAHAVSGKQVFDAHVAAIMIESGVERILTFNVDDFRRYPGITAVSPHEFTAPPAAPAA